MLGDGATERAFLPPVLREALGPLAHGISVVDSVGMNDQIVRSVIKFARHVEVPLVVFADADQAGVAKIANLIADGCWTSPTRLCGASNPDSDESGRGREVSVAIERMMIAAAPDACRAACEATR